MRSRFGVFSAVLADSFVGGEDQQLFTFSRISHSTPFESGRFHYYGILAVLFSPAENLGTIGMFVSDANATNVVLSLKKENQVKPKRRLNGSAQLKPSLLRVRHSLTDVRRLQLFVYIPTRLVANHSLWNDRN